MAVDILARGMAAKALKEAEQGGGGSTPHLYVYEISIELADDPGTINTALMFSKNYYENFDVNKGQTSTITFDQFINDIYCGLDFGGMTVYDIDLTNKTFGLSGASVYGANDVTFICLIGKQIF